MAALEVDVLSSDARLFVKLDIHGWLVSDQDRRLQVEVQKDNKLVGGARLVEEVLDVREHYVHLLTLSRVEPDSILVDLQTANRLPSNEVRSDNQSINRLRSTAFEHDELLDALLGRVRRLVVPLLVQRLELLHALLDLLGSLGQPII